jgi:nucleoside-diphosphate-sugar epimerase
MGDEAGRIMELPAAYQPVLVTGATGFIGANLVRRLVALGCRPHLIVRPEGAWWRLADVRDRLAVHEADLSQADRLRRIVAEVQPQTIYHLATYGAYPATQADAERVIQTNVLGTWNLLQACLETDFRLMVNMGSSSEYGASTHPMREDDPLDPANEYGVAKAAQSLLCRHMARVRRRPIVTVRPFSVYGPYEEPARLFPTMIRRCLEGLALRMVRPELTRDFTHVDDIVDACLLVDRLSACGGEAFNIATGVPWSMQQAVDAVLQATGARVPVEWGRFAPRVGDPDSWVADCAKTTRLLGWSARIGLEEGVRLTVAWFREHREFSAALAGAREAR